MLPGGALWWALIFNPPNHGGAANLLWPVRWSEIKYVSYAQYIENWHTRRSPTSHSDIDITENEDEEEEKFVFSTILSSMNSD